MKPASPSIVDSLIENFDQALKTLLHLLSLLTSVSRSANIRLA